MRHQEASDEAVIRRMVRRINELWLSQQYDDIGEFLSKQAVIAPPGFDGRIRGRAAYVQSYREYDQAATMHEFSPGEPGIDDVIHRESIILISFN
ncbi:MAG: hypothetical protein AAFX95_19670 [Cyanobacteria bacterium J06639_16]